MPRLTSVAVRTSRIARRPRAFVRVVGPDAEDYLQRMVSNDVAALAAGESCEALLLTPKARLIAPLRVFRRGAEDFLVATEPELGDRLLAELTRMRFAAKCELELEQHESWLVLGGEEVLDERPEGEEVSEEEAERARIEAGVPRWGHELDERILPAEAGLTETHVSFTKGCYPGQEPIARLQYRGHANRGLRVLELDAGEPPPYDAEIRLDDKPVGRVTSAVVRSEGGVVALGYVRTDVPPAAELRVGTAAARSLD
jgi:folate-binding protein YgfZ